MFERYTERARRVLFFARYEASQLGSVSIHSEHLLLGLTREGKGLTNRMFAQANVTLESIRRDIEGRVAFREKVSTSVEIPFSAETKRVLQFGADEADRLEHNYIGTEHLLLGLLREERCVAAVILNEHGMTLNSAREDFQQLLKDGRERADPNALPPRLMRIPRYLPSRTVHISYSSVPASLADWNADDRSWNALGVTLGALLARLYDLDEERVLLPATLADGRLYDVVLVLPSSESAKTIVERVREELVSQFNLLVSRETDEKGPLIVVKPR